MSDDTRTYEVITTEGRVRFTVPATYKITFGALVPGKSTGMLGLRVWESETKQRLVLTNVVSFRDISIPMQRLAVRKFGSDEWFEDTDDLRRRRRKIEGRVEQRWVNVDDIQNGEPEHDTDESENEEYATGGFLIPGVPLTSKKGGF